MPDKNKGKITDTTKARLHSVARVAVPTDAKTFNASLWEKIKPHVEKFSYPIANHDAMLKSLAAKDKINFNGVNIDPKAVVKNIPLSFFPIKSADEFASKLKQMESSGETMMKNRTVHEAPPSSRKK